MDRPSVADYPAGARLPRRVIDDHELVWMLRGEARLETRAGETGVPAALDLVPGRLLLVPPGVPHGFTWDQARPSRHGYVHFGAEHLDGLAAPEPVIRRMTADDPLAASCAYLLWLGQLPDESWRGAGEATLRFLLRLMLRGPLPAVAAPPALEPPLATAVDHLAAVWARAPLRRVEVGELAAAASVSRGYLTRLFRAAFGRAPAGVLERARLARAEALLERTGLGLEAVAASCGFADASHLSHRFRSVLGMSPRSYRAAAGRGPSALDDSGTRRLVHLIWTDDHAPG